VQGAGLWAPLAWSPTNPVSQHQRSPIGRSLNSRSANLRWADGAINRAAGVRDCTFWLV
jgi:hypothetical protein